MDSPAKQPTIERPRYRKPRGADRLVRMTGLWRLHGNTLPPALNRRYRKFHRQAQAAFTGERHESFAREAAQLHEEGLCHAGRGLDPAKARDLSERLTNLISAGGPQIHQHHQGLYRLNDPLDALGTQCLDLLDGPAGRILEAHYGSHFRIEWVDCYRTYAGAERKTSWLWHIDNVPAGSLKVMLLLTDSTRETGAMRYLPRETTHALRRAGYFGVRLSERELSLEVFARRAALKLEPQYREAPAGDVLLFDPNILHCGEPPLRGHRDVMTFFIVPSLVPWREALKLTGTAHVQSSPGGYPSSPAL